MPFALSPVLKEHGKLLFDQTEGLGRSEFVFWTMRKSFIDKNRAAMIDFMEDMLRIVHWYMDPANKEEVQKIASKITKVPPERFGWLFTNQDTYRDRNLMPNLDALQKNVEVVKELGLVKTTIDVKKHSDLSLVQEALARLKK
jgi:NitT/TauT family transport system substrate-binding protein